MYAMYLLNVRFLIKGSHLSTFKNVQSSMVICLVFSFFFRSLVIILGLGGAESM